MQYKITESSDLLDNHGELIQKGYATFPILDYHRKDVARKFRLKEWDYYLINNDNYATALLVCKISAIVLISVSFIDFKNKREITKSIIRLVSKRKLSLPESSEIGDIIYADRKVKLSFVHHEDRRELGLSLKNFDQGKDLDVSIRLTKEPKDTMVIATPFKKSKKEFYYNQKIIGMSASGMIHWGGQTHPFYPDNSFGLLDWGRGVWPYQTTWYWSAGQGRVKGNLFGFNLGYGFGDTSAATENMLFYNGWASKLEDVVFDIPKDAKNEYEYQKPWKITSSDHRLDMIFEPILDRNANLNAFLLSTNQHQVFGKFTGYAILDNGMKIEIKDFTGFAERVENRW